MAKPYQIKPTTNEYGYDVFRICDSKLTCNGEATTTVGQAETIDHARFFAVSPLMIEALEAAREYVINTTTDCRECNEPNSSSSRDKTIDIIDAAIAAAKGE
jgi:hypothetical protein